MARSSNFEVERTRTGVMANKAEDPAPGKLVVSTTPTRVAWDGGGSIVDEGCPGGLDDATIEKVLSPVCLPTASIFEGGSC